MPLSSSQCSVVLAAIAVAVVAIVPASPARAALAPARMPRNDAPRPAAGPFASMRAELEASIFKVDVCTVDVRFDEATRDRLEQVARSSSSFKAAADKLAHTAIRAENAWARIAFERDIPAAKFASALDGELQRALKAGAISEASYRDLRARIARWFDRLGNRGIRGGDTLLHRATPQSLRTTLVDAKGEVLFDCVDHGDGPGQVLLAGLLAPKGALREKLLRSLGG